MGCRSDYLAPGLRETESREVAAHLIYVCTESKQRNMIPQGCVEAVDNIYGNLQMVDTWTAELCGILTNMSPTDIDRIVYNAREPKSRRLADWWERHQEWDKKRLEEEAKAAAKAASKQNRASKTVLQKKFAKLSEDQQKQLLKSAGVL